jgi:hypothetical protein
MAIEGYAIEERGSILVDTVRSTVGDAKVAAAHTKKIKGADWQALVQMFQWRIVRVEVRKIGPDPAPPPAPLPAALVVGSDQRPIRLARKR